MGRSILITLFLFAAWPCCAQAQSTIEGFTEPFHKVDLSPAEPGILMQLLVKEADEVKAGDKLAVFDTRVLEITGRIAKQLMESKGKLRSAQAEREVRQRRLDKLTTLKSQGHASSEEIERASADLNVAEANVLVAEEQLAVDALEYEKSQALLEQRIVRSPIDGVVAKVHREEREYVTAQEPIIITVVQLNPLRIIFPIPSHVAGKLRRDQQVVIRFPDSEEDATAKIEIISPITDAESGLVRVKVVLPNPEGRYRCGIRGLLLLDESPAVAQGLKP
ncbi:MAG: efflux RND transporter periplasmic adaptor subunit [Planctomycetes bacterium]|nr:efflux RND transporter periplasmic adaptor subunit [Planctomycetota bacterium]